MTPPLKSLVAPMIDTPSSLPLPVPPSPPVAPRYPWYHWRRLGFNFLTISILAHLLFALVAAYLIVQVIRPQRKQSFGGGAADSGPKHAIEHKVQMQKQRQSMSAPTAKRVTTTGLSKVALPTMPSMPAMDSAITPVSMSAMSGATGLGLGKGNGNGNGNGGGGGGGGGIGSLFGVRTGGAGLTGTFYDLKQNTDRQSTNMTPDEYGKILIDFVRGDFNADVLSRFYKGPKPLYTTQIWIPIIPADLGPAAFGLQAQVKPMMWCVHYKGTVTAPGSFTFHFVGAGDDVMLVKFDGKLVLDRCWYIHTGWQAQANYSYGYSFIENGFAKGDAITVEAGKTYPLEVLIGEQPGGEGFAALLQEIDGASYNKDSKGNPILPVFRMSSALPASDSQGRTFPPHRNDGPVWRTPAASSDSSSIFSH